MRYLFAMLVLLVGCPEESEPDPLDPDRFTDEECNEPGATRCDGLASFQSCQDWRWYNEEACGADAFCTSNLGCVACDPFMGPVCVGDHVYSCEADGSVGGYIRTCPPEHCTAGLCSEPDCAEGTDLVYVVDNQYRLLSFDPFDDAFTFTLLGNLSCPAANAWPGWGSGAATPFSMSVDRSGRAWILYNSGELFWVPTDNLDNCQRAPWTPGTENFELFGMGFVTNSAFSSSETLYIAGGTVQQLQAHSTGRLGQIDPADLSFSVIGSLSNTDRGPELTGTGAAELWGFFPSDLGSTVGRIDRTTGLIEQGWAVPGLPGEVRAWAFAHWGGVYFMFVTYQDIFDGTLTSQVQRFNPETGDTDIILSNSGYMIVGAGVSTCAPVVIQ